MKDHVNTITDTPATGYFDPAACNLADFTALINQTLTGADVPFADDIQKNIPIYDMSRLGNALEDPTQRRDIMAEWARGLLSGSGGLVLQGAYADTSVLDQATAVYETIIAQEKAGVQGRGRSFRRLRGQ